MSNLNGKTIFITGASRGIGLAIAQRAAQDGANVVIAAKTHRKHPKLAGTIHTAAESIEQAGGQALAVRCDIRDEEQVAQAVAQAVERFGGIDACVNNASAIMLTGTLETPMKRFDLMHQVNQRGTFLVSQACLPHLLKAANPHILTISPPLNLNPKWFGPHVAYAMAKYGMSLTVLGLAEEFKGRVAVNALWPQTTIATAAIQNLLGGDEAMRRSRKPEIMADAAHHILTQPGDYSGQFLIDEEVMAHAGVTDLSRYAVDPSAPLTTDLFLDS